MLLSERRPGITHAVKSVAKEIGRTPAEVAINRLFAREGVVSVIPGARKLEPFDDNLTALEFTLDPAHPRTLEAVSAIELGCPHEDICSGQVRDLITGGAVVGKAADKSSVIRHKCWELPTTHPEKCPMPATAVACGA